VQYEIHWFLAWTVNTNIQHVLVGAASIHCSLLEHNVHGLPNVTNMCTSTCACTHMHTRVHTANKNKYKNTYKNTLHTSFDLHDKRTWKTSKNLYYYLNYNLLVVTPCSLVDRHWCFITLYKNHIPNDHDLDAHHHQILQPYLIICCDGLIRMASTLALVSQRHLFKDKNALDRKCSCGYWV